MTLNISFMPFCMEELYLNAGLLACRQYSASSMFREEEKLIFFFLFGKKKQKKSCFSLLECIAVVEVSVAVLFFCFIFIRFYTVGNFYTWTLSYKGNKINNKKKFNEAFHCHWMRACKVLLLNAKVLLILKPLLQNINFNFSNWNKMFDI